MKTQVVINIDIGGFGLSNEALLRYCQLKGFDINRYRIANDEDFTNRFLLDEKPWGGEEIPRDDLSLLQVIEELGLEESSGECAELRIREVEIPLGSKWVVKDNYDGAEEVYVVVDPQLPQRDGDLFHNAEGFTFECTCTDSGITVTPAHGYPVQWGDSTQPSLLSNQDFIANYVSGPQE